MRFKINGNKEQVDPPVHNFVYTNYREVFDAALEEWSKDPRDDEEGFLSTY